VSPSGELGNIVTGYGLVENGFDSR